MAAHDPEKFFEETNEPHNFDEIKALANSFVEKHVEKGSRIVLVSVRNLDNFF